VLSGATLQKAFRPRKSGFGFRFSGIGIREEVARGGELSYGNPRARRPIPDSRNPTHEPEVQMSTPAPETIVVEKRHIACDGGGGALGHPRVFLEMGTGTEVECPYCDRRFVLSRAAAEADQH